MEQQAEEAITRHSSAVEKLIRFLRQNYKDVIQFDATKQFFQQNSNSAKETSPFTKKNSSSDSNYKLPSSNNSRMINHKSINASNLREPISEDESGEELISQIQQISMENLSKSNF
jgi:hypothetical protein